MKTIRRTQMKSFEGKTLDEFTDNFNRGMEWVARFSGEYDKPVVDIATLRAYVIFTEIARIPENYRDRLDLANMRVSCGQCKHFESTKYNWGVCPYCVGELRKNDECCDSFFKSWEDGECWLTEGEETYGEAIDKIDLMAVRKGA